MANGIRAWIWASTDKNWWDPMYFPIAMFLSIVMVALTSICAQQGHAATTAATPPSLPISQQSEHLRGVAAPPRRKTLTTSVGQVIGSAATRIIPPTLGSPPFFCLHSLQRREAVCRRRVSDTSVVRDMLDWCMVCFSVHGFIVDLWFRSRFVQKPLDQ